MYYLSLTTPTLQSAECVRHACLSQESDRAIQIIIAIRRAVVG